MENPESTECRPRGTDLKQDILELYPLPIMSLRKARKVTSNIELLILQCLTWETKGVASWANPIFV